MKKGFIQIIIILALLVIIMSLMGVSLSVLFSNPILKNNFGFLIQNGLKLWNAYLSGPFWYIFDIFKDLIWQPFLDTMRGIKGGGSATDIFKNQ